MYLWVRDREQYTEIEYEIQQKFKGRETIKNIYESIIDEIQGMKKDNEIEVFKCSYAFSKNRTY